MWNPPRVVNKYKEKFTLYIGRGSKWGNPFSHRNLTKATEVVATREEAIRRYEEWARRELWNELQELNGEVLGCFCKPKACHGDVLVKLFKEKYGV